MIYGETTDKFTIFTSCDPVYLKEHAKGLVTSCALNKNNVHIHVTNPKDYDLKYLEYLQAGYNILCPELCMTYSYDTIDLKNYNKEQRKTFYACNRFIVGPEVIKGNCLLLDVDCFIMEHIDPIDADIGLYLRNDKYPEWGGLAGKIAAGSVYCDYNHLDFLVYTKDFIESNKMLWFVDQVALLKAFEHYTDKKYYFFDNKYLDWDFKPNTKIWTGKGTRKSLDATYGAKHKEFKRKFPLNEKEYFK